MSYFKRPLGDDTADSTMSTTPLPGDTETVTTSSSDTDTGGADPGGNTANWQNVGGVCYATNDDFLALIKNMQRQLNRVATAAKVATIAVDGAVGPLTIALVATVSKLAGMSSLAAANVLGSTCDAICTNIASITGNCMTYADTNMVSSSVSSPSPATTPQIYNPVTASLQPQGLADSASDMWSNLSTPMQIGVIGAAVVAAYFISQDNKTASSSSSRKSARTARTSRRY
jgi:hypothetical protein